MAKLFDPKTYKLYDVTTGEELIYSHKDHSNIQPYCIIASRTNYQIAPHQLNVGKVSSDIVSPSILTSILNLVTYQDFSSGFSIGFSDGFFCGTRKYYMGEQNTSWSFLVGYEYGVQLGAFYKQHK